MVREIPWWFLGFPHRCVFRLIIIIILNHQINDIIVDHNLLFCPHPLLLFCLHPLLLFCPHPLLLFCPHPLYLTYQCLAFRLLQSTVD